MPLRIAIVGGSSAGLMHGVMAKRLGHDVHIFEQYPSSIREGQAAGISTGAHTQKFLERYDLCCEPCYVSASTLRVRDYNFDEKIIRKIKFRMTSWNTLYYRLRANFDGLSSPYVLVPPKSLESDGEATYNTDKRVTDVASQDAHDGISIKFEDMADGTGGVFQADMVIAADGANSSIRQLLLPQVQRQYAGYVTWRATIPESRLSQSTLSAFEDASTAYYTKTSYVVVYSIPGDNGDLRPGKRHVNFVWYYNCSAHSEEFSDIMTDVDGHCHVHTLPPGKMRPEVWTRQRARGEQELGFQFKEILAKIDSPFITAISDYRVPRASFFGGKVVLVGDALALFRPHTAQSTAQAAVDCTLLEQVLKGEMDVSDWEQEVLQYAHRTGLASNCIGAWYLRGYLSWLYYKVRSWISENTGYLV
ncbi:FAD/NAD(P)-binding domain-containing protein [Viridothelium virens]|uniref:FAD/NAD(P)-binding domain-containing protein n=1 Tax=Viridothelium virens TaxID=1048519 RepID=A0A6A6H3D0_VIRVR|nr:FAD/NAD(P)-binding domain-containing protein [Viridothelium virens]